MIALMLVLPILFVLVVYSAVNAASLDVQISVNGIEIMERYPDDTISIDLADYDGSYEITPSVKPANASNRQFEYRYERVSGAANDEEVAAGDVVEVVRSSNGTDRIMAHSVGTVRIVAVSKDGGYEDSITAIVGASKPYAFDFSMYANGDTSRVNLLMEEKGEYFAALSAGQFGYTVKLKPNTYLSPRFQVSEGFLQADSARGTISLPFTGTTAFDVTIPNGVNGALTRHVELEVENAGLTGNNFAVNGSTDNNVSIRYDRESRKAEFFVEAEEEPEVDCFDDEVTIDVVAVQGVAKGWRISASMPVAEEGEDFPFEVTVDGRQKTVTVQATEFDFVIRTDIPNFSADEGTNILMGTPISFYAEPIEVATGITYRWDFINVGDMNNLSYETNEDGSVCTVTAKARDKFIIVVEALRDNSTIVNMDAHEVEVEVINNVIGIQSVNTQLGLAKRLAVAGYKYADGQKVVNRYAVNITAYSPAGAIADGIDDLEFSLDSSAASIVKTDNGETLIENGCIFLDLKGKDEITLTASWKGNEQWRIDEPDTEQKVLLTVDNEAVEVTTSGQLFTETEAGNPIVLGADIMLGTDDAGQPLSIEARRALLKTMRSTYNTQFYETRGEQENANVNYVVEFKNDVYGNGHSVCGEYFSNAQDNAGVPIFFKGPRVFVSLGELASVAAQDNIVFLCRTDNVTIHNATLLGCSDESRINPDTSLDDLTRLTNTGTVLDINADVNVLNCRVRNGRNVIRVYGGNRNGESYFINSLSENRLTAQDRAVVRIDGCVLSHSREFILKTGTNRALRATSRLGREPYFTDRNGANYASQTDSYLDDAFFYQTYVLTDLTLKDSVLEKSGLFCVGVEANFAGEALAEENRFMNDETLGEFFHDWAGVGGTSFAALVRLEGNVRMYDWKELGNINSDTLIQGNTQDLPLKLDLAALIEYVQRTDPDHYSTILENEGDTQYVHGGIALYGGGRNYSQISTQNMNDARKAGLGEFRINLSVFSGAEGETGGIGRYLPLAAGSQDFRFFMYESTSPNGRAWQTDPDYSVGALAFE